MGGDVEGFDAEREVDLVDVLQRTRQRARMSDQENNRDDGKKSAV